MSKKAKQFGIAKQSKRRQKRKKRDHNTQPAAIVPRRRATVIHHLFESSAGESVRVTRSLRHLLP